MSLAGWIIMLLSVGGTTIFYTWCIRRVLRQKDSEKNLHGILDTERQIEEDEEKKRRETP